MSHLRQNISTVTGNVTGVTSGTVAGNKVFMGGTTPKVDNLSALVAVTANTSGLTFTHSWQVSVTASTWYTVKDPFNATTTVALATGASGGGNVANTKVIPAPTEIKGWAYARLILTVAGGTGTTSDVYSIGYSYRQTDGS